MLFFVALGGLAGGVWLFGRGSGGARGEARAQRAEGQAAGGRSASALEAEAAVELAPAEGPAVERDGGAPGGTSTGLESGTTQPEAPASAGRGEATTDWLRRILPERFGALSDAELLALENVDLHGATVGDADLWRLALLPNLKDLGLRGTQVTDAGIAALTRLPLRALDLRATQVSGNCFALLPAGELEALHLTDTRVSEADLARLPTLPALKTLKLNFLELSDLALERLAPQPHLTHLELDQTGLTDDGLRRMLAQFPALQRIEARNTRISNELRAELEAARPALQLVLE